MASSRLGLHGARGLLSLSSSPRIIIPSSPATAMVIRRSMARYNNKADASYMPSSPKTQLSQAMVRGIECSMMQMMLPGTLIPPPISQYPRGSVGAFFRFAWDVLYNLGRARLQCLGITLTSKGGVLKKRKYKLDNKAVLLEAKALHREMAEALAMGDKTTLGRVCVKNLNLALGASIARRGPSRRYAWELVRYNGWRGNPRIVTQMIAPATAEAGSPLVRQVVVRIDSKQRRLEYVKDDSGWHLREESTGEVDAVENVVLVNMIDPKTWKPSEWRILGIVGDTTPEQWAAEQESLKAIEKEELRKFKL